MQINESFLKGKWILTKRGPASDIRRVPKNESKQFEFQEDHTILYMGERCSWQIVGESTLSIVEVGSEGSPDRFFAKFEIEYLDQNELILDTRPWGREAILVLTRTTE